MITDLSDKINFRTLKSEVTGNPVFLSPLKFFVHLLSFGPVVSMEHLNRFVTYRDKTGEATTLVRPNATYLADEVFTFDMNWDSNTPELGIRGSANTRHLLVRVGVTLPSTKISTVALQNLAQVKKYDAARYNVSPKTLAYFLQFGEVRRVKHENPLDYNPLTVISNSNSDQ